MDCTTRRFKNLISCYDMYSLSRDKYFTNYTNKLNEVLKSGNVNINEEYHGMTLLTRAIIDSDTELVLFLLYNGAKYTEEDKQIVNARIKNYEFIDWILKSPSNLCLHKIQTLISAVDEQVIINTIKSQYSESIKDIFDDLVYTCNVRNKLEILTFLFNDYYTGDVCVEKYLKQAIVVDNEKAIIIISAFDIDDSCMTSIKDEMIDIIYYNIPEIEIIERLRKYKFLLRKDQINFKIYDIHHSITYSLLNQAIFAYKPGIVKFLLESGSDPNIRIEFNMTLLHAICYFMFENNEKELEYLSEITLMVKYLLEHFADKYILIENPELNFMNLSDFITPFDIIKSIPGLRDSELYNLLKI